MSKDDWRLLRYGLLTATFMGLVLAPILIYDKHFPKLAAEAILGFIAGAVFLYPSTGHATRNPTDSKQPLYRFCDLPFVAQPFSRHSRAHRKGTMKLGTPSESLAQTLILIFSTSSINGGCPTLS